MTPKRSLGRSETFEEAPHSEAKLLIGLMALYLLVKVIEALQLAKACVFAFQRDGLADVARDHLFQQIGSELFTRNDNSAKRFAGTPWKIQGERLPIRRRPTGLRRGDGRFQIRRRLHG